MTSRRRYPSRPPRPSRRQRQTVLWLLVLLIVALLRWWSPQVPPAPPESLDEGLYRVERVVDGDTLELASGHRVRLIGADTPETVKPEHPVEPWGPEATEFTRQFVAGGEVRLQFDGPRTDKYGRVLAYVWVGDRMLNEELLRAGLARAKTHYTYSPEVKRRFRRAEAEAQSAGRGIWS